VIVEMDEPEIADRLQPIVLIFSKAPDAWAARRSICAVSVAQLVTSLRAGARMGDGIVRQVSVNIRGGNGTRNTPTDIRTAPYTGIRLHEIEDEPAACVTKLPTRASVG
jgi:hypothetical protein